MEPKRALKWMGVAWVGCFGLFVLIALAVNLYVHVWVGRP